MTASREAIRGGKTPLWDRKWAPHRHSLIGSTCFHARVKTTGRSAKRDKAVTATPHRVSVRDRPRAVRGSKLACMDLRHSLAEWAIANSTVAVAERPVADDRFAEIVRLSKRLALNSSDGRHRSAAFRVVEQEWRRLFEWARNLGSFVRYAGETAEQRAATTVLLVRKFAQLLRTYRGHSSAASVTLTDPRLLLVKPLVSAPCAPPAAPGSQATEGYAAA